MATLLTRFERLMSDPTPGTLELYALADDLEAIASHWRTPSLHSSRCHHAAGLVRRRIALLTHPIGG